MASPASTETIEIRRRGRRRLIGAIAIVVLLVVFVPMLLDSEPQRHANEPPMQIPPKENAPPLPAPAKASPSPLGEGGGEGHKASPSPLGEGRGEGSATASKAAPRLEGFAVQVGAFKDEDTLRQARSKLTAAGVSHYTERIEGGLTRLRAGPFPTREAAEKARATIQKASLEGQVVALP
jgi:DedD protein